MCTENNVQRDQNAKEGKDAYENWQGVCGPFSNDDTNERGLSQTFGVCRLLVITKHPEEGHGIAQTDNTTTKIDYILVRKRFRSGVNIARTRSFPGADI